MHNYHMYINCAQKKGYSGVAVYTKEQPQDVNLTLGLDRFDSEGRFLELTFSTFTLLNLYIPHGGREKENLGYKPDAYSKLLEKFKNLRSRNVVLIGDFNIAHEDIDLARPSQNRGSIMFTPEERHQLDAIIDLGFLDSFRLFSRAPGNYTWWPYAFDARTKNLGWRLDYAFVSEGLRGKVSRASIYPKVVVSDHCPISLVLE